MHYKQNEKILQLSEQTLIIGVDIAKERHVARAQDYRGIQFGKVLYFDNSLEGFQRFECWRKELAGQHNKSDWIIGMEPTGHYWLPFTYWLMEKQYKVVVVNPAHVKKSKELDDNSPTKNDVKDARVISRLIQDGRYADPHLPEAIYADLREGMNMYEQLMKDLQAVQGRVHQWLDRYYPEYTKVFANWEGKASIQLLKLGLFPEEVAKMDEERLLLEMRKEVKRGIGLKKIRHLKEVSSESVGIKEGRRMARVKIHTLMDQYALLHQKINEVLDMVKELIRPIPGVKEMTDINGIGEITVASFLAETGELNKYTHPEQIIKLAGLNLKLATSGKYKGQTVITKRGRPKLRALLFKVVLPLVHHNPAFKALHGYFTTRKENSLKKKQSLIALCCKLIRVLFTVGTKQVPFSPEKMLHDIPHFRLQHVA
ncbi:IS110 family transposase [Gracilibacillus caseinilyticus]|uniref:IS110 family transposase n=1 Tax=Gracilibacillus caseinilyticus TaxID=2932256 RepID=A0ABY4F2P6_9BACI|nr:IS110 family transposase [Gracilibacillus caseinilyticus]UOQ50144.1 IS110 family transposase [Gracilibacillus caseinilyticus]